MRRGLTTHANATGRLVKNPKRMLASPDKAAVAVTRSRLTTADVNCGHFSLLFSQGASSYCSGTIDILPRLHRFPSIHTVAQNVVRICKCRPSLTVCPPGAHVK